MIESSHVEAPYPGLRAFESHEGEIFFGRETHTDALLDILQREHFLAVVGPSGSGKSSLVRAGLLPALAFGIMGTGADWRIAVLRPGNEPVRRLAQALLSRHAVGVELIGEHAPVEPDAALEDIAADVARIEAELNRGRLGLVHTVTQTRRVSGRPFNLLVLVDQFEELFTYVGAGAERANESEAFVNLLLAASADRASRVHVAITMRTDFLGNCVRFLELPQAINKAQYLTPRLTREQLEKAVVGPARVFGGDVDSNIMPELINSVADNPDQLPVLQHALARMWIHAREKNPDCPLIDRAAIDSVGGVKEALNKHAEQIYSDLSEGVPGPSPRYSSATRLFRAITERRRGEGGGQEVRRPQTLARIAEWTGEPWQAFVPVVRAFSAKGVHFLQHGRDLNEQAVIDISHEALIRQWKRLRGWVVTESERASEYVRWRQLEDDHRSGRSGMLTGVDLARAAKWLGKDDPTAENRWRPTARWARRYAAIDPAADAEAADAAAREEFRRVQSFIERSLEESERSAREAEERKEREQRFERERLEAIAAAESARATAAEREGKQTAAFLAASKRQSRRFAWLAVFAVLCGCAAAIFGYNSKVDRDRADAALQQSERDRDRANAALRQAELDRTTALEARISAEAERAGAEYERREAELAKAETEKALHSAREAEGRARTALASKTKAVEASNVAEKLADEQRQVAQRNEANAKEALREATMLRLAVEGPVLAGEARGASTVRGALMALAAHRYRPGGEAYVGVLQIADRLHENERIVMMEGVAGATGAALSRDGKRIVCSNSDYSLRVWNAESGEALTGALIGHTNFISAFALSPDGKRIVSGSLDRTLRLWDTETGKPLGEPLKGHTAAVTSVAFSPDGKRIASGGGDNALRLWDAETGKPLGEPLKGHTNLVGSLAFSPDGKRIASGGRENAVRLWDADTGKPLGEPLKGHTSIVGSLAFSPDAKRIVSGSADTTLRLWDAEIGTSLGEPLKGHTHAVISLAFSPDGKRIVSGGADNAVRLWDADTGKPLGEPLKGHTHFVHSVRFSPDAKRILSGSIDGTVRVWHPQGGRPWGEPLRGHSLFVTSVALSPDGERIVSGGMEGTLRLWDAHSGKALGAPLDTRHAMSVAFSPDGKRMVSGAFDGTLLLWDALTGKPLGEPLKGHTNLVGSLAFSPDGKRIVSGGWDNAVRLWDAETGKPRGEPLKGHADWVSSVAFSPDGKRIVSGSKDATVRLWDAESGKAIGEPLKGHTNEVNTVAFSPDGTRILSGSDDNTLRLWDAQNGTSLGEPLKGHTRGVNTVAFSPDGRHIVSGSGDNTLRLWDTESRKAATEPLKGHTDIVSSVAFSRDGKYIVSGSSDSTLRRWPMPELLHAEVCAKLPRNMTREEWKQWVGDLPYRRQCPNLPGPPEDP